MLWLMLVELLIVGGMAWSVLSEEKKIKQVVFTAVKKKITYTYPLIVTWRTEIETKVKKVAKPKKKVAHNAKHRYVHP